MVVEDSGGCNHQKWGPNTYMNVYLQHDFFGSHLERKCTFKNPTVGGKGMHGETVQEWKPQI